MHYTRSVLSKAIQMDTQVDARSPYKILLVPTKTSQGVTQYVAPNVHDDTYDWEFADYIVYTCQNDVNLKFDVDFPTAYEFLTRIHRTATNQDRIFLRAQRVTNYGSIRHIVLSEKHPHYNMKELEDFALEEHLKPFTDCYFTINSFKTLRCKATGKINTQRCQNTHISKLNGFYVDIDCHEDGEVALPYKEAQIILGELEEEVFGKTIPYPTTAVYTGRGIQLYFVIDAVDYHYTWYYKQIQSKLINTLKSATLSMGQVDSCKDASRYLRIPGSYNMKAWDEKAGYMEVKEMTEYRTDITYTIQEVAAMLGIEAFSPTPKTQTVKEKPQAKLKEVPSLKSFIQYPKYMPKCAPDKSTDDSIAFKRIHIINKRRYDALFKLIKLRDGNINSYRHLILYNIYYYSLLLKQDKAFAEQSVFEANALFSEPLSEKDVLQSRSAQKLYARGTLPKKNKFYIMLFNITLEEQLALRCFNSEEALQVHYEIKKETKRTITKEKKTVLVDKCKAYHLEGFTKVKIAELLHIDRKTVSKYIAA